MNEDTPQDIILEEFAPKRYAIVRQSYIYARNLIEAQEIAESLAKEEDQKEDNKCVVSSVAYAPFGQI